MANNDKRIMKAFEGYLTPGAQKAVEQAEKAGMDRDLAIAYLEATFPISSVYTLEEDEFNGA